MAEKILVVDDSKLVTDIVKMRLGMYGYEVRLAHSGEEALKAIEEEVPDLLVLDVHMPGIDGYEVCRRLRDNPAFDDLRIIMLTSSDDKHAAFEAGVDDSFATRELIRSILNAAGYDVATAVDGLDALDRLRAETYDLVVSDVEMPRVDGFTLTSRIRSELGKTDLPVIIVTSLASEAHRRRGLEVGAQAYIVKSQFNQNNLLETIQQLIGM